MNLGDFASQATVYAFFNTHSIDGAAITLAGTPSLAVYKDDGTTEDTSGPALTVDFDSKTGLHLAKITTTSAFYSAGHDYQIVIASGTVDGISVVGSVVGEFSIENRSALRPTVAGRTLDVTATGEAGIDLTNKLDTTGILPAYAAGAANGLPIVGSKMDLVDAPNSTGIGVLVSAIWDQLLTAITTTGSIGKRIKDYLDAAISSVTSPTVEEIRAEMDDNSTQLAAIVFAVQAGTVGSSTYTDTVEDADGDPIDGVSVECYSDIDRTTLVHVAETDANGAFVFHLGPATYYFRAIKVGYSFTDWTKVVT